jgi:hypothetical protein
LNAAGLFGSKDEINLLLKEKQNLSGRDGAFLGEAEPWTLVAAEGFL